MSTEKKIFFFDIISVNISEKKGTKKFPVERVFLVENFGIQGDAHAERDIKRQVSLLGVESIEKMRNMIPDISVGDFAENITTKGINFLSLGVGTKIFFEDSTAIIEISQIGKECHLGCEIKRKVGNCVMPKEGVFAKVLVGGFIESNSRGYYYL